MAPGSRRESETLAGPNNFPQAMNTRVKHSDKMWVGKVSKMYIAKLSRMPKSCHLLRVFAATKLSRCTSVTGGKHVLW